MLPLCSVQQGWIYSKLYKKYSKNTPKQYKYSKTVILWLNLTWLPQIIFFSYFENGNAMVDFSPLALRVMQQLYILWSLQKFTLLIEPENWKVHHFMCICICMLISVIWIESPEVTVFRWLSYHLGDKQQCTYFDLWLCMLGIWKNLHLFGKSFTQSN